MNRLLALLVFLVGLSFLFISISAGSHWSLVLVFGLLALAGAARLFRRACRHCRGRGRTVRGYGHMPLAYLGVCEMCGRLYDRRERGSR